MFSVFLGKPYRFSWNRGWGGCNYKSPLL